MASSVPGQYTPAKGPSSLKRRLSQEDLESSSKRRSIEPIATRSPLTPVRYGMTSYNFPNTWPRQNATRAVELKRSLTPKTAIRANSSTPHARAPAYLGKARASTWSQEDDVLLMQSRAQGMNWAPIAQSHFPAKTPNACRKRHERLMERKNAENGDSVKLEELARAYVESREMMWKIVADKVGEKWQHIERECMEKGLKTLQAAARSRRTRDCSTSRTAPGTDDDDFDDSGLGPEPASDTPSGRLSICQPFYHPPNPLQSFPTHLHQNDSSYHSTFSLDSGYISNDPAPNVIGQAHIFTSQNQRASGSAELYQPKLPTFSSGYSQIPGIAALYQPNISPEVYKAPAFPASSLPLDLDFKEQPVDKQKRQATHEVHGDRSIGYNFVQAPKRYATPPYDAQEVHGAPYISESTSPVVPDSRRQPEDKQRLQVINETPGDGSVGPGPIQPPDCQMQDHGATLQTTQRPIVDGKGLIQGLRILFGALEPPLEAGKRRIRWKCSCGFSSFDDFEELYPGALDAYEELLRTHLGSQQSSTPLTRSHLLSNTLQMLRLANTSRHSQSQQQPVLPQHNLHLGTVPTGSSQTSSSINTIFLLLYLPHRRYATKLIQPSLEETRSDRDFFELLQTSYVSFRGRYRSFLSLKTLKRIKFVHFEMYKSELVDIRIYKGKGVIPPENLKDEYHYRPIPAKIIPPIGENHMMHLCSHPEDADSSTAVLMDRVPKKLRARLCASSAGTNIGWGIHYVEGWHLSLVWLLSFLLLLLASLVFLVCWGLLQHDVQGASGVATYVMAFITLSIGGLQAAFEMELL